MECFAKATNCKDSSSPSLRNPVYLPDDILLNCLARVSRLYYPILSLVSKRFRSMLISPELYKTRILLGYTETCLYLCLSFSGSYDTCWYTLCRRPTQIHNPPTSGCFPLCFNKKKDKNSSINNLMVPVATRNNYNMFRSKPVSVGSNIYMVGGGYKNKSSVRIFCMDCWTYTWYQAPCMRISRTNIDITVLDGKIYVTELNPDDDYLYLLEFFDTITEKWGMLPTPSGQICGQLITGTLAINGNIYVFGDKNLVYKPKENRWEAVEWEMDVFFDPDSCCVIDNVLYYYAFISSGKLKWYDFEERTGRVLKGLKKLVKLVKGKERVRLVNYGGKLAVMWVEDGVSEKMIWCAEISLDKRNKEKIRGKVEWCHVVLTVPYSCHFEHFIAATV